MSVRASLNKMTDGAMEVDLPGVGRSSAIVLQRGDHLRAYLNVCPHAGRLLSWAPGRFLFDDRDNLVCPAHGATFDLFSGECLTGPCPGSSLREIPAEVDGDDVILTWEGAD